MNRPLLTYKNNEILPCGFRKKTKFCWLLMYYYEYIALMLKYLQFTKPKKGF